MQFEIGETVNLRLEGLVVFAVETDEVGAPWITLLSTADATALRLPLDGETVHLTRKVPADGVPQPGETWADQLGSLYVARLNHPTGVWLVNVDEPGSSGQLSWENVHTGMTGPIFRVAERPQVGGA